MLILIGLIGQCSSVNHSSTNGIVNISQLPCEEDDALQNPPPDAVYCAAWFSRLKCATKGVNLKVGYCVIREIDKSISAAKCPYFQLDGHNKSELGYIKLPNNISELND